MNNSYKRLLDLVVEGKWGTKDKSGVRKPKPPVPSTFPNLGGVIKRVEDKIGAKPRPEPIRPPKPVKNS